MSYICPTFEMSTERNTSKTQVMTKKMQKQVRKSILNNQILRLAKIYNSRPVKVENFRFHDRVLDLQCELIKEKHSIK